MKLNTKAIDKLRSDLNRINRIVTVIEEGGKSQEIVEKVGINRQLADYYIKKLTQK